MMSEEPKGSIQIDAELDSPGMLVQLVQYHFTETPDSCLRAENYFRIELCLTARHRNTQACFTDVWSSHRFEHVGDLFILPPSMEIRGRSEEATSLKAVVCHLKPEPILQLWGTLPDPTDRLLLASLDVQDPRVRSLMLRLAEEAMRPGFASEMLVDAIATQMVIDLFRRGRVVVESHFPGGLAPWQLRRINERLNEIYKTPTLTELAALCQISVRQLTRGFRASRGCSIGTYVVQSQMDHAKSLLATNEAIASIALMLGFSSSSNFCAAFRREIGLTPGQFRQRLLRT